MVAGSGGMKMVSLLSVGLLPPAYIEDISVILTPDVARCRLNMLLLIDLDNMSLCAMHHRARTDFLLGDKIAKVRDAGQLVS
ncbi:MAG: hypothetical protein CMIDDMOC_00670 [Sodalis sp. Fle]|nr:MAG: hypothetical protein CMIDDMOC_00670 [Sodalis sp. Fle]